jgi:Tol biopolymer transport system component
MNLWRISMKNGRDPSNQCFVAKLLLPVWVIAACCLLLLSCSDDEYVLNLDEEAQHIPWDKLSGRLAFFRGLDDQEERSVNALMIIDADNRQVQLVFQQVGYNMGGGCWKPDGSVITYEHFGREVLMDDVMRTVWEIRSITPDGLTDLPEYPATLHQKCPSWSNNGRLAWNSGMLMIDGTQICLIADNARAGWSPDSRYLAVPRDTRPDSSSHPVAALYRLDTRDDSDTLLLQTGVDIPEAYWITGAIYSSDGASIAFTLVWSDSVTNQEHAELWLVQADGTNPRQLTSGYSDHSPAWSPSAQYVAFVRSELGMMSRLYIVEVATGEVTQVTQRPAEWVSWIQ